MANARVRRGRKTQDLVADRIRHLFPSARGVPASLGGVDVQNTPGWALECKATATVTLPLWMRQAKKNAGATDVPVVIYRANGFGEASIDHWAAVIPLGELVRIMEERSARHDA